MFACIYIPDFPVEAIVRVESSLRDRAVAVLDGKPPLTRVIAMNEKARTLGVERGMTKLEAAVFADIEPARGAHAISPEKPCEHRDLAVLRQRSPVQETSAHAALLDVAHAFTPRVEDTAPDTLLLDLAGLERLYGTPAKMAGDLMSRITAVGIEANIAVAANPDAAMHAARGFNGTTIIPTGQEQKRLGVLPIQVLLNTFEIAAQKKAAGNASEQKSQKMRQQMLDTLERWGVRDFRTLALLPDHALASRLGEAGVQLRRLARGDGNRTLVLCAPSSRFEESMELECAVETIESLSFVLNRLLEQLCARLEARALAAHELHLHLQLEPRVADEETTTQQQLVRSSVQSLNTTAQKIEARTSSGMESGTSSAAKVQVSSAVETRAFRPAKHATLNAGFGPGQELKPIFERSLCLPVSMRDSKVFLKLLQLELAAHPPGAPVTKIWITAEPASPRSAQRGLFLPVTPEAERLEITLARINAVVGERRAGIAQLLDSHRQERFRIDRFAAAANNPKERGSPTSWDLNTSLPLALRIWRPARRLHVSLSGGQPNAVLLETRQPEQMRLEGKVLWSAGPWRSSGDWWTENANKQSEDSAAAGQSGPWDREEWDIAVACAGKSNTRGDRDTVALYRIYRDLATGDWFVDASYD